jgi:hypothetical protein
LYHAVPAALEFSLIDSPSAGAEGLGKKKGKKKEGEYGRKETGNLEEWRKEGRKGNLKEGRKEGRKESRTDEKRKEGREGRKLARF